MDSKVNQEQLAAEQRAQELLLQDQFEQDFETANTALTLSSLPLSESQITLKILQSFIANAYALSDVCAKYFDYSNQISVLLWLRDRLENLISMTEDALCQQLCRNNADIAHDRAQILCDAQGNITVLPSQALHA